MHGSFALAAPIAFLLPLWGDGAAVLKGGDDAVPHRDAVSAPQCDEAASAGQSMLTAINPLTAMRQSDRAQQIRIEQRVVVRIVPQPGPARLNLAPVMPDRQSTPRLEERGKEKCVAIGEIAGVQTGSGNRLVLFLRDSRMVSVNLEKSCRARDFYAGFYVEKNKDGRLCVDRDKLRSRTGAWCEVATMRQLVVTRG